AALNGHAIGGGLEVALSCDLRVGAAGAVVGMPPAKLGLVYSHTGLQKFIDAIGVPRTRELFLVGSNIPVEEALVWGLVNAVHPPDELPGAGLDLAVEIAGNAPLALSGNKTVIRRLLDSRAALNPEVERDLEARARCRPAARSAVVLVDGGAERGRVDGLRHTRLAELAARAGAELALDGLPELRPGCASLTRDPDVAPSSPRAARAPR